MTTDPDAPHPYAHRPYPVEQTQQPFTLAQLTPGPPGKPPRTGLIVGLSAVGLVVIAGMAVGIYALTTPRVPATQAHPGSSAATQGTIAVIGSLTLTDSDGYTATPSSCTGDGGYSDIHGGTQVTITDGSGAVIGLGTLNAGVPELVGCTFSFAVSGVPAGQGFYGVNVGANRRGTIKYAEADITKGVDLELGG